ncbi:MAG: hypothetical protein ABWX90_00030 [Candidatus Saccharimonadales bacterium]
MTKRNFVLLAGFFVAVLSVVIIAANVNHCPTVVSKGICLAAKEPSADPQMPQGMMPVPAPTSRAETAPPAGPITVNQSLKRFDGFTGKTQHFLSLDTASTSTPMIGIEITQEGYKRLLDGIGYEEASLPSTVYLARYAAESIGYTSNDPAVKFVLIMEGA